MSIKVMSQIWDLKLEQNARTVLMCLADHADDDGTHCYPSVAYIAWKTGYSRSSIQRLLRDLRSAGLIVPASHARGGRGWSTEYNIHLEAGEQKEPYVKGLIMRPFIETPEPSVTGNTYVKGVTGAQKGVTGAQKGVTGDAKGLHSYEAPTVIEPSLTVIEPSLGGADAPRFQDAPETFGQPATGPLEAENVTKAINAPPRRPVKQHDPLSVSPEFVARMRERYPGLDVEAEIDTALNHTAVLKALDVEKYVGNWLRRTNGWVKETRAASARSPATNGVGQDGDPMEKYHRLAKELGQEGG